MADTPVSRFTGLIPPGMDVKTKKKTPQTAKQKAAQTKPKGRQLRTTYGKDAVYSTVGTAKLDPEQRRLQERQRRERAKRKRQQEQEQAEALRKAEDPEQVEAAEPEPAEVKEGQVWVPDLGRYMSIEELENQLNVLKRSQIVARARECFLTFIKYMFPDFEAPDDPTRTSFEVARHHALIAKKLEAVERGDTTRMIITIRPRAGKSEMVSRMFSAWHMGRHMRDQVIAAGYNYDFAVDEIGSKVLAILQSERYQEVFPEFKLRADKKAAGIMRNERGGQLAVAGVGGSLTGRGANLLILDDLFKNWEDAESARYRDTVWNWYTSTAKTRLMKNGRIVIIMCMTGETPILMPDGSERRLDSISAGDVIATYRKGALSTARVEAARPNGTDQVYRITTASGKEVRANARHPFLVHDGEELKWVRVRALTTEHRIVAIRDTGASGKEKHVPLTTVKNRPSAKGSACRTTTGKDGRTGTAPQATIKLRDEMPESNIGTASQPTSTTGCSLSRGESALFAGRSLVKTAGAPATGNSPCALTTVTTPARSGGSSAMPAISPQDTLPLSEWHIPCSTISDFTLDKICSIEPDGAEEVFDLQVAETENFIANGVVSHNTRWHEDDIVGRLTDPSNDFYKEAIAKGFEVLEIPDVAGDGVDITKDPLGREPGEVLWPEWFPTDALEMKTQDERVYYALYQGQPRPPGGVFFKEEHIQTYGNSERPALQDLTIYGSCDLSASPERDRDASVYVTAGMDRAGVLWVLDIWWGRVASDDAVDFILAECTRYQPTIVFWETGPITKTITPFLERRMRETHQYTYFETYPATANKAARARGLRGMMAAGMVRFPRDHEHFGALKNQVLKFTGSGKDNEDDAVDAMSGFGMMLSRQTNYQQDHTGEVETASNVITLDWIKRGSHDRERRERLRKQRNGM